MHPKQKILMLIRAIQYFSVKIRDDYVTSFSAHAAFFIIISFFPFIMFLLTMFQHLPFTESSLLALIRNYLPSSISAFPIAIVQELYSDVSGAFISITVLTTLWSASKGFYAIMRGLNSVYGIRETRNYFLLSLLSIVYTVIFAVMLVITMGILVFGNQIFNRLSSHFPWLLKIQNTIHIGQLILPFLILTVFFLFMFRAIPNRRTTFRKELPGAVLVSLGWIIFSKLYSFYIDNMSHYSSTYGSLTAVILFMLWLYFCMYILFIGSEINVVLGCYHDYGNNWSRVYRHYEEKTEERYSK